MQVKALSQRNPQWAGVLLGTSGLTLGNYGCLITAITIMFNAFAQANYTPAQINSMMNRLGGFASKSLVIWGKIPLLNASIKYRGAFAGNVNSINTALKEGNTLVLCEVRMNGYMHFVVAYEPNKIIDTWDGKSKPMSTYRIITAHYFGDKTPNQRPKIIQPKKQPRTIKQIIWPRRYYIVRKGETLGRIAGASGISLLKIRQLNPQIRNINLIYPGQKLRIK